MIGQITPLVQAASKKSWVQAVVAHWCGAIGSAALLGLALGALGTALSVTRWQTAAILIVAAVFLFCAFREADITTCPVPSLRRQTPKKFMCAFGPIWGPFAWGLELGQGWTTSIEYVGYYAVVLWAFLLGGSFQGAVVLAIFGLGRGLPILLAGLPRNATAAGPLAAGYETHHSAIQTANVLALAFVGSFLAAAGLML